MQKRRLTKRVFLSEDSHRWHKIQRFCLRLGQSRLFDQALLIFSAVHLALAMGDHHDISPQLRQGITMAD